MDEFDWTVKAAANKCNFCYIIALYDYFEKCKVWIKLGV